MRISNIRTHAFTLIELSIVLVILGLITGGILVGRDLINAAAIRAQISQIQQYQVAVNSFKAKYAYLPGDMVSAEAQRYNFVARASTTGRGDGDGQIAGACYCGSNFGWSQNAENLFFWEDLTSARMISESFSTAIDADIGYVNTNFQRFFPQAKIRSSNYVYVWSGGIEASTGLALGNNLNYFGLSVPSYIAAAGNFTSNVGLSVWQAHALDNKTDDGLPLQGNIIAYYSQGGGTAIQAATNAPSASVSTCFDTTTNQYSITQNNGAGVNCALSFKFQ